MNTVTLGSAGRDYLGGQLLSGGVYSRQVVNRLAGKPVTFVPIDVSESRLHRFDEGGLLRARDGAEQLRLHLLQTLLNPALAIIIFEDEVARRSDFQDGQLDRIAFAGDDVYHCFKADSILRSERDWQETLGSVGSSGVSRGFITTFPLVQTGKGITWNAAQLAQVVAETSIVFASAYDGESFVLDHIE
jgi:hypothetical protein